jgi:hypothetical protein
MTPAVVRVSAVVSSAILCLLVGSLRVDASSQQLLPFDYGQHVDAVAVESALSKAEQEPSQENNLVEDTETIQQQEEGQSSALANVQSLPATK